ncbi:flagellar biosynthetic protein FliO [Halobacillus karajensis]|uniref:Flagella biosynthesis protein FliZ n=1 Tax=Halobacillus karajensis TaxID=195088 RepID=A0A024P3I4_9BACI|nr:flagellar biosynthetic protein FliO [Halobacillus karajensis]CDQ19732.1 flagella biosynthesis protein FliZ [Halobacillus karajensis]CDQ22192.1 flagella biosynthesis protein FliZ [Halobacillus karajensis]CDQ28033.1 flagella biosynthesis protein FliZ [Halobacillus karajensis]
MISTTRMTAAVFLFLLLISLSSLTVMAEPSAFECLDNPQLEGCPSSEGGEDVEKQTTEKAVEMGTGSSLIWNIVKLIFALIFVVVLIYGLLKFFNQKNKVFNQNRTMENLGGMNLAPNRSIQAVRIGEQILILGVGESVQMITEVSDEETRNALLRRENNGGPQPRLDVKKWMDKWNEEQRKEDPSSTQFQHLFEKQLNDMKGKRRQAMDQKRRGSDYE